MWAEKKVCCRNLWKAYDIYEKHTTKKKYLIWPIVYDAGPTSAQHFLCWDKLGIQLSGKYKDLRIPGSLFSEAELQAT